MPDSKLKAIAKRLERKLAPPKPKQPTPQDSVFMVEYPVSSNRYWRHAGGRTYVSAEGKAFKLAVAMVLRPHFKEPVSGPIKVTYWLHPRMNKDGSASELRLDIFNAEKVTSDALNGIAWLDDKQIVEGHVYLAHAVQDGGLSIKVEQA
jgi:crossover junction endodeoxyribonuclease RusA